SCDYVLEIARQHQAQRNTLNQENEALRRKLADISNDNDDNDNDNHGEGTTRSSKRQKMRNPSPPGSDNETLDNTSGGQSEDQFVNAIGQKFCILYALWVHKGEDIFKVKLDDAYDAIERFENDNNKVQGQLQEIVSLLKEKLNQDTILQKWVRREFMKSLNSQRANTASRIRHNCSAVFGILDTDLVDPEQRKARFRGRIGWVPNKTGGGTYSSVDVDIIHKDYLGKYDLSKIFLSPVLMAARWALSSDVSLQEVGSSTGIRYFKDYEEYLTMLEVGLRRRKKSIVNIFREWDAKIFPDTASSLASAKPSNDYISNCPCCLMVISGLNGLKFTFLLNFA
ncbi:hypothetical protein BGW80DRAFT_1188197, partial [Lactifluus volemus]